MAVQKKRHAAKALTWRILASSTTFVLGWIITGSHEIGLSIGVFDFIAKFFLYYIHERVWYRFKWGIDND